MSRHVPRHRKCDRHDLGDPMGECDPYCLTWTSVTTGSLPVVTAPLPDDERTPL